MRKAGSSATVAVLGSTLGRLRPARDASGARADGRVITAKAISEREFQQTVISLAKLYRWRTAHFRAAMDRRGRWATPVQGDGKGFPDIVLTRGGRLIFAELKSATGKLTDEQVDWLQELREVPSAEVHVWRPRDLERIAETLR